MAIREGDGLAGQPTEASLEDAINSMSAEDEQDDSPEDEEGEESEEVEESEESDESEGEEDTFTIKVDGKEVALKKSELIEQAQKGFDYTQKTMALAEERKHVEREKEVASKVRQDTEQVFNGQLERLQALEKFYETQVGDPPPIEWAQQDAAYFLAQKELYDQRKGQLQQAREVIAQLQQDQQRYRQAWIQQQADETERELSNTLPGWNANSIGELAEYVDGYGLNAQTLDAAFVMPGIWKLAHKAMLYDKAAEAKSKVQAVQKVPKVSKPGSVNQPTNMAARKAAFEKVRRSPSIDSIADLL